MKTDKKQCLSMKTVLTVGRTQMTSGHATVCIAKVEKKGTKVDEQCESTPPLKFSDIFPQTVGNF